MRRAADTAHRTGASPGREASTRSYRRLKKTSPVSAQAPVLMKLSGHTSVRSLAKYARVSDEGLRRYQADSDPATRRRPGR
ncbi:hypothetical protein OHB12_18050 [Nocardia sp. NBC_01730]|uniref:hypothetical protein n=1 Tax=Nocardia sp. NBC_01730 TaxID=2975998 RepID=UPI002E0D28A4|nr:hypothetical protein OHB12_18050 [Nocardia sp. NBC_01730]